MAERSEYEVTCECGAVVRTHEPNTKCAACGRLIQIELPKPRCRWKGWKQ